jgi:PAS domain S-box-containing protein
MGVVDEEVISRIRSHLRRHPKGMMISELSSLTKINRNIMAKYLEILLISGQVEMEMRGNAKVYTLSKRAPLSALFETSSDCIIILDGSGRIAWANPPLLSLTGKTSGDLTGKTLRETEDPFLNGIPYRQNPDGTEPVAEISFGQDDETQYFRIRQVPAVLSNGSTGSIISCEDVTSEVVYKQMVELSEARFRAIVEDQSEFIARFLPDGRITFVNGSCARFFEKKPEEIFGMQFASLFGNGEAQLLMEKARRLGPDNPLASAECRVTGAGGCVRQQEWTIRALFDRENRVAEYQVVGRDVTEKAEAEERLRRYASDMEFISEKVREFMELPATADIYAAGARALSELIPGVAVAASSIVADPSHPGGHIMTVRETSGIGCRDIFRKASGFDPVGISIPFSDPAAVEYIKQEGLHEAFGDIYSCVFGQVPYLVCRKIEEELNLGITYIHGLVSRGRLFGEVSIYCPKGVAIPNPELVETFIRQVALIIAGKDAEKALLEEDMRFRAIAEDQGGHVARFQPDGTLTFVNESLARSRGIKPGEPAGASFFGYFCPEDADALRRRITSPGPEHAAITMECRVPGSGSETSRQQWTVRALPDDKGNIREFLSVGRDITDIRDAEEGTRQHAADTEFLSRTVQEFLDLPAGADIHQQILGGLCELVPDSIITVSSFDSRNGSMTVRSAWSQKVRDLFRHLAGEDLIGKVFPVTDPDALSSMGTGRLTTIPGDIYYTLFGAVPMAVSQQIEQNLAMRGDKFSAGLVSGENLLGAVLIIPEDGKPLLRRDIIELYLRQASLALARQHAADALRISEERFRGGIEDQTELVARFLPDGTLLSANIPFGRLAGTDRQDLTGRSFLSMIPGTDRQVLLEGLRSLDIANPKMETRHRLIDTGGGIRWLQWTYRAIFDNGGTVAEYNGIGRDITDLHDATTRIRNHPAEIRMLAENAKALSATVRREEILAVTAKNLRRALPNTLVGICSYSPSLRELSFLCLESSPEDLRILKHELGRDPAGITVPFGAGTDPVPSFLNKRITPVSTTLGHFLCPGTQDVCTRIAGRCNFGRTYLVGLPSFDGTLGSVLLQLKTGTDLKSPELIEAIISQAGLALSRKDTGVVEPATDLPAGS